MSLFLRGLEGIILVNTSLLESFWYEATWVMRKIDESSRSKSEREEKSRDDLPSTYARLTFRSRYSWSSAVKTVPFKRELGVLHPPRLPLLLAPAQVIATDLIGHRL